MEGVYTEEKRQCHRIRFSQAVQFQLKDAQFFGGSVGCDISESGIRLNVSDFVPLNTEVALQIQLSNETIVDCIAKVVWVRKFSFSDRYQLGLEFRPTDSLPVARKEIQQYMQSNAL